MDSTPNPTPNQLDSPETRLQKARDFLQENPNEKPMIAAKIYDIPPSTLYSAIKRARFTAQQENDVRKWFKKYQSTLKEYNIKRKNVINFDEAGFRVGCSKGQFILVPDDINEYYALSPEDRRSLTIFEVINATGSRPPPPFVVIQGKWVMADWYTPEWHPDTKPS
ncbi:hypothetical protein Egran_03031 [Elaphomyces granulatus]|uniref:HTH psq-type domain-containing protein n=1 Tax=Elaphomyces granulatus TaxID=519963 RepID=A0A232LYH9_9EURO|nr:hypothetical protein Egran_03031 [Elaphomyces granulatus]